ncbi:o-succinylbenzoate synthase [Bifidobacterium sp. ESL0798]|uniref:o-succinylbenzoate synthase n=1 Tax=Bifidobacterium sp. ESL0798 TaxID=2983235 RepID=UPI0023F62604|nr:o-succinylbenzoate synthase [Bifidobacterium sp. ESL0798]WEV74755.1 o-succinylbenzoate synthase [Bifidobacterium sp. ESL0798]
MRLTGLKLLPIRLHLKHPFVSAHETLSERLVTLVAVRDENGNWGYGELEAFTTLFYTNETQAIEQMVLRQYLWSVVRNQEFTTPPDLYAHLQVLKGHHFAKAALDMAVWDLYAKQQQLPLAAVLAKQVHAQWQDHVAVGISLGLQDDEPLLAAAQKAQEQGYQRIKLKVKGNADLQRIGRLRQRTSIKSLTVDANQSLQWTKDLAATIDRLQLTFIEDPVPQPSAKWAQQMHTPICLDEPITSVDQAKYAWRLQLGQIISVKQAVIGGLTPALELIMAHRQLGFDIWCGGMLEGGIGRAANLALASLTDFAYPGDLSATERYYQKDYTTPLHVTQGLMPVSHDAGVGVDLLPMYQELLDQQKTIC